VSKFSKHSHTYIVPFVKLHLVGCFKTYFGSQLVAFQ